MPTPTPTTPTPTTKAREVVDRLSQLGDPVRIRAVRVLEREELAVGELAKVLQIPQSSASRHLKVLSEGGWLVRRPAGPATYYRVVLDDLPGDARAIWTAVRDHAGRDPEMLQDDARLGAVLDERMADSSGFFGRHAGQWDDLRAELFGRRFTDQALLALINPDWVVADLGCGTGNFQGPRPLAGRAGPQGDPPGRARDARPDGPPRPLRARSPSRARRSPARCT
jgi:DNA-binding transcriptional ArsR family regulator